ncbi:MAG: MerR family transcriptional regulator, partial [Steroidobacteraceae bacterium]
ASMTIANNANVAVRNIEAQNALMKHLSISSVAQQFGLRASALRYYERIGLLPATTRVGGRRQYGESAVKRLAVILCARKAGFTLDEVRELILGFSPQTPPPERWRALCTRKDSELQRLIDQLTSIQALLRRLQGCRCGALEECGTRILRHAQDQRAAKTPSLPASIRLLGSSRKPRARPPATASRAKPANRPR